MADSCYIGIGHGPLSSRVCGLWQVAVGEQQSPGRCAHHALTERFVARWSAVLGSKSLKCRADVIPARKQAGS